MLSRETVNVARKLSSQDNTPAIVLDNVYKRFGLVEVVKNCSLVVPRGAFVSLLGPSGCGKTTLLRMIGGFEQQSRGNIHVSGSLVDGLPPNKRDVNTVFQRYALFPHKTVAENVAFPLEIMGVSKADRHKRVLEMLALVHLEGLQDRRPAQLSGGQAQRVALARALAGRPSVLLLDEPLAALDLKLRKAMQLELRRIQQEVGTTFLYVTHDQEEALTMSDTIVLMSGGQIVQQGTPVEIYDRPRSVFASQFIGEANLLHGRVAEKRDSTLVVTVGGLRVVTPMTAGLIVGDEAVLSIRPEQLIAGSDLNSAAPDVTNHAVGIVRQRIFLGHIVRLIIEVAPGVKLTVEHSSSETEQLEEGSSAQVGWSANAVRVIRDAT